MEWGPRHEVCHRSDVSLPTSCKWPPSFIAAFNFSLCQPTPIHLERGDGTQRIEVTCDRQVRNQQSHQSLVSIYHRGAAGSQSTGHRTGSRFPTIARPQAPPAANDIIQKCLLSPSSCLRLHVHSVITCIRSKKWCCLSPMRTENLRNMDPTGHQQS